MHRHKSIIIFLPSHSDLSVFSRSRYVLSCNFPLGNVISCCNTLGGWDVAVNIMFLAFLALFGTFPTVTYCRVEWLRYLEKRHLGRQHLHFMLSRKPKKMEVCFFHMISSSLACYLGGYSSEVISPFYSSFYCCAYLDGHTWSYWWTFICTIVPLFFLLFVTFFYHLPFYFASQALLKFASGYSCYYNLNK